MSFKYLIVFLLALSISHADLVANFSNKTYYVSERVNNEMAPNIFNTYEKLDALEKNIDMLDRITQNLKHLARNNLPLPVKTDGITPQQAVTRQELVQTEHAKGTKKAEYSIDNNFACKKREVRGYNYEPLYRIDNETLRHVTLRNDSKGVAYFEMHIAMKALMHGHVIFSPVLEPAGIGATYFLVDVGGFDNTKTYIQVAVGCTEKSNTYFWTMPGMKDTPNILSPSQFTELYVKIKEGTLELGLKGSSSPLVSYSDERLTLVKYFGFACWNNREATFLYDCPPRN